MLGTAAYLAPEQALGEPATPASDRYALAVVAFELLTGTRPFQAEHFAAQARAHVEDEPPRASDRDPELPRAVDAVLARGLAKPPAERWGSAGALVEGLEAALGAPRETRGSGGAVGGTDFPTRTMVSGRAPPPPRLAAAREPGRARARGRRRRAGAGVRWRRPAAVRS